MYRIVIAIFCLSYSNCFGQWNKISSILNSSLFDVGISSDGIIYTVGTDSINNLTNGAIFKSLDGGSSWLKVQTVSDTLGAGSYMTRVSILDSGNLIVSNRNPIIYRSANYGMAWQQIQIPTNSAVITDAMYFRGLNLGFIGNHFGEIFKSIDGGSSWTRVHANPIFNPITDINCPTDSICYARTSLPNKLLKTSDGGNNWYSLNTAPHSYIRGGLHAINRDTLVIVTSNSLIFRSLDGGTSWDTIPCPVNTNLSDVFFVDSLGFAVGDSETILKSIDFGESWSVEWHDTLSSEHITSVHISNYSAAIAASNHGSIFRLGMLNSFTEEVITPIMLTLFPNPVAEKMKIVFNTEISGDISIFNLLGHTIYTEHVFDQKEIEISLPDMNSGYLYVRFTEQNTGQITIKKMIRIRV